MPEQEVSMDLLLQSILFRLKTIQSNFIIYQAYELGLMKPEQYKEYIHNQLKEIVDECKNE